MANVGNIPYGLTIAAGQSIRRNAGDTAFEAYTPSGGGGGSPGGSNGQLQYNNSGAFGGTAAIVYSEATATEHVKITAQAADSTQLLIQEHATQSVAALRVVASDGATSRFSVIPSGYTGVGTAGQSGAQLRVNMATATDIGVRMLAAASQSSDYIRLLDNSGTHISSINSNGYLAIGGTTSPTTMIRLTVGTNTHNGIIVQAHASQNSGTDLLTIRSNTSVLWLSVSGGGLTGIGQGYTSGVQCHVTPIAGTNVALRLRGHSARSGNYLQIQTSTGTNLWGINSVGNTHIGGAAGTGVMLQITPATASDIGLRLYSQALATASHIECFDENTFTKFEVRQGGRLGIGKAAVSSIMTDIAVLSASDIGIKIQGAASQSGDYLQILNSAGTTRYKIDSEGRVDASGSGTNSGVESVLKLSTRTCESLPDGINKNGGVGFINLVGTSTGNSIMSGGVNADTYRRIRIESGGRLSWSSGAAVEDLFMERVAAATMSINGSGTMLRISDTATTAVGVGGGIAFTFPSLYGAGNWARIKGYKDTSSDGNVDASVLVSCWNSAFGTLRDHTLFHHYGYLGVNKTASLGAMVDTVCRAATDIGVRIQAATSQSADLLRFVNAAGTTTMIVPSTGDRIANSSGVGFIMSTGLTILGGQTSGSISIKAYAGEQVFGDANSGSVWVLFRNAINTADIWCGMDGVSTQKGMWVGNGAPIYSGNRPASSAAPTAGWLSGTSGSGTNIAGGALNLAAGRGTGSGAGGSINLYTSIAGASGSTASTAVVVLSVQSAGTAGRVVLTDAVDISVGTTNGTKIGTANTQKLGFWNATPVVQQVLATGASATVDDVIALLQTLGLCKQA